MPDEVPEVKIPQDMIQDGKVAPLDLITHCGFAQSRGEARRLVSQHGIKINGSAIKDGLAPMEVKTGDVIQRGKRQFARLVTC